MGDTKHTHHDRFTFKNSLSLNIMNLTYLWTRSFLLSILLTTLLRFIDLLIHGWPRSIVLPGKTTISRKVPNLSALVTWEVSIIWWVIRTNTSGIRLAGIGRNYSGSDR